MADRVSTIRFRVEGTHDIVSRSEEISKAIVRQQRELANSVKAAMQGGPNGGDATKLAQQQADQLKRLHVMLEKEKKAQFDKETEITDAHMRGVANRENAERAALDRMLARQTAAANKAAEKQYAAYVKNAAADARADAAGIDAEIDAGLASSAFNNKLRARVEKAQAKAAASKDGGGNGLAGFGGKMIVGHALGMAAGDILGDQHGGREFGSVAGAAMFGGPVVAGAVAGLELLGDAFRTHRDYIEASQKAASDYRDTLMQLTETWSKFATSQINSTGFGKGVQAEFERLNSAALKAQEQGRTIRAGGPGFSDIVGAAAFGVDGTAYMAKLKGLASERDINFNVGQVARQYANDERDIYSQQMQTLYNLQRAGAVSADTPSMEKESLRQSAKHGMEFARQQMQFEEENRAAAAGVKMSNVGNVYSETDQSVQAKTARQAVQDAQAAQAALDKQQLLQHFQLLQQQDEEEDELAEQHKQQILKQQYKTSSDVTASVSDQYSRSKAIRDAANNEELREAAMQGAQILALKQQEIAARVALESKEQVEKQAIRSKEAEIKAATDVYHRQRALRDNAFDEELKQAQGTGNPAVVAAKQEEIANLKKAEDQDEQFQARIQLDDALIRATKSGYEQQAALQENAYRQELERAKAQGTSMLILTEVKIAALRQAEARANQIRISDAMASFDPKQAAAKLQRQEDDWRAMGATPAQVKALKDEALTGGYRRQSEHLQVEIQLRQAKISQMQADVMNATIDNPMARAKGKEGDAVRKAIVDEAALKEQLRKAEQGIINVGQFGSSNAGRFLDVRSMNLDQKIDPVQVQKDTLETARQTLMVLNRIAANSGVN